MVSHGLITGSLFLFAGVLWRRAATFEIGAFGGLVQRAPVLAGALMGIVITAGLFLWTIQRLFLGPLEPRWSGMADMALHERVAIFPLLALVIAIGLMPYWILEVIGGFSRSVAQIVAATP